MCDLITGYVDAIDSKNDFMHIYDYESRHYVAVNSLIRPQVGQFVEFTPIIPKFGKFKKAVIHRIFLNTAEGAESFGYRDVQVIATHPDKGYCSWQLVNPVSSTTPSPTPTTSSHTSTTPALASTTPSFTSITPSPISTPSLTSSTPSPTSTTPSLASTPAPTPIFEIGVEEVSYTTGYMSLSIPISGFDKIGMKIEKGTRLRLIVFLKRYKGNNQPATKHPHVVRAHCPQTHQTQLVSPQTHAVSPQTHAVSPQTHQVEVRVETPVDPEIGKKTHLTRIISLLQKIGKKDHLQQRKLDSMILILKAIDKDPKVTIEHLCHLTGRSQSTIQLHLGYLVSHNLISRQGPDKGGFWSITGTVL